MAKRKSRSRIGSLTPNHYKVENRFDFFVCMWRATYRWKALDEGYNFALNLILIGGLHTKLLGPKIKEVPTLGISKLPSRSPGTKYHLDVGLVERHKIYYKGKGGGFPQVRAVMSFVSLSLPMVCPNTKNAPTMH